MGIPFPPGIWHPFVDETIPPDALGKVFGDWLTGYYVHGDLSKRDPTMWNIRNHDANRKRTFENLPAEEFLNIVDFSAGQKIDTSLALPPYHSIAKEVATKALYDSDVRESWPNLKVWSMVGEHTLWNIIHCWWTWEKEVKTAKTISPAIRFTISKGANHFVSSMLSGVLLLNYVKDDVG